MSEAVWTPSVSSILIAVLVLAAFMVLSVFGQRGMCKWTKGSGIGLTILKNIANLFTMNILGIVLNFALPDRDCVQVKGE